MKRFLCLLLILALLTVPVGAAEAEQAARSRLNANEQMLYDFLREQIISVAGGQLTSTKFEADSALLRQWEQSGMKISWDAGELGTTEVSGSMVSAAFVSQFSIPNIIEALMHDLSYDLYWFDKTAKTGYSVSISRMWDGTATISRLWITLPVVSAYQNGGSTVLDASKTAMPMAAAANAKAIVEKYAHLSDYEKLVAYRKEICALVDYDPDILDGTYTGGFGDPWQLTYVFDGDSTTNVVCEGYAKAFQYLCDLSDFDYARCYSIHGVLTDMTGPGSHMWNIVTMEDGEHYLVDVTNSEDVTIGAGGTLFLAGGPGSIAGGYTLTPFRDFDMTYTFDSDTLTLWGDGMDSILNLADSAYVHDPDFVRTLSLAEPTLSGGQVRVELLCSYRTTARLMTAFYQNGRMVSMEAADILTTEKTHLISAPAAQWDTCRVFLLDTVTHAPLCGSTALYR